MKMLLKAIKFSDKAHENQFRKGSGDPYITHPLAVSYILYKYKVSRVIEELVVACLLHDVMEDCGVTFEELAREFSPLVASLVLELTNDPVQMAKVGKAQYQIDKMCGFSSWALVIKLADRIHNISDNPTQKMVADTLKTLQSLESRRTLTYTQLEMVQELKILCYNKIGV